VIIPPTLLEKRKVDVLFPLALIVWLPVPWNYKDYELDPEHVIFEVVLS
jgi:hypothetical protein